jgi:hypothetical protein
MVVCGKPKSGKSHLIKCVLHKIRKLYPYGLVFTKTSFTQGYDFVPKQFIHTKYNPVALENLLTIQRSNRTAEGASIHNALILFDDCLDGAAFKSQLFTDLCTQYRHYGISLIISTQYIYKIPPTLRETAKYAAIFRQSAYKTIEACYESFGQHFTKDEWRSYLMHNTGDYRFIFITLDSPSENRSEIYCISKAPDTVPKFHLFT